MTSREKSGDTGGGRKLPPSGLAEEVLREPEPPPAPPILGGNRPGRSPQDWGAGPCQG